MRKIALKAIISFALLCSVVVGLQAFEVAWANWALPPDNVVITIQSPQNMTYKVNEIPLNFTVERNLWHHTSYVLDDEWQVIIESTTNSSVPVQDPSGFNYKRWTGQFNAVLSNLSDGIHILTVRDYVVYDWEPIHVVSSANVSFIIDTQSGAVANMSLTPQVTLSPTTTPDTSPSNYPTQQPASISPSPSPAQQSATILQPPMQGDYANWTLYYIFVSMVALVIIITAIYIKVYFKKHHRKK